MDNICYNFESLNFDDRVIEKEGGLFLEEQWAGKKKAYTVTFDEEYDFTEACKFTKACEAINIKIFQLSTLTINASPPKQDPAVSKLFQSPRKMENLMNGQSALMTMVSPIA